MILPASWTMLWSLAMCAVSPMHFVRYLGAMPMREEETFF